MHTSLSITGRQWFLHTSLKLDAIPEQLERCKLDAGLRRGVVGMEVAPIDELISCSFCLGEDPALAFKVFLDFIAASEPRGVRDTEHRVTVATHPLEVKVGGFVGIPEDDLGVGRDIIHKDLSFLENVSGEGPPRSGSNSPKDVIGGSSPPTC